MGTNRMNGYRRPDSRGRGMTRYRGVGRGNDRSAQQMSALEAEERNRAARGRALARERWRAHEDREQWRTDVRLRVCEEIANIIKK